MHLLSTRALRKLRCSPHSVAWLSPSSASSRSCGGRETAQASALAAAALHSPTARATSVSEAARASPARPVEGRPPWLVCRVERRICSRATSADCAACRSFSSPRSPDSLRTATSSLRSRSSSCSSSSLRRASSSWREAASIACCSCSSLCPSNTLSFSAATLDNSLLFSSMASIRVSMTRYGLLPLTMLLCVSCCFFSRSATCFRSLRVSNRRLSQNVCRACWCHCF
mmetsp:Transcript_84460/g.235836  ORF Transcript_84460/g.235836 Transcript_84460/m.235836 type:complete len:228 (-) Transcript_84460:510-1193(-)